MPVTMREIITEIIHAMKRLGAKKCDIYAPMNMPKIVCYWNEHEYVELLLLKPHLEAEL